MSAWIKYDPNDEHEPIAVMDRLVAEMHAVREEYDPGAGTFACGTDLAAAIVATWEQVKAQHDIRKRED